MVPQHRKASISTRAFRECIDLLCGNRFRHLPVVVGKVLVGMLSNGDILQTLRPALLPITHSGAD